MIREPVVCVWHVEKQRTRCSWGIGQLFGNICQDHKLHFVWVIATSGFAANAN